jgi:dihydroorotate dehydrogenase
MIYDRVIRPVLFSMGGGDPEAAHHTAMDLLKRVGGLTPAKRLLETACTVRSPRLERKLFGLTFRNPVGLAAGFDKNAVAIPAFEALGFGFLEIGTITRHSQPGNPKPRIFRYPADEALINRMGFNNDGADAVAARLKLVHRNPAVVLGVSIGKSKVTPIEDAVEDYLYSLRALYAHGDYFAVNVSSPNTPGLRQLQDKALLDELLAALTEEATTLGRSVNGGRKPLLVKVAPDLDFRALDELLEVCVARQVDGLIAVNTTLSRAGLTSSTDEAGGLSGSPLRARALEVVQHIRAALPEMPIIGAGGIMSPAAAVRMLKAGANLLQIYTGLIYQGPLLVRRINKAIAKVPGIDVRL